MFLNSYLLAYTLSPKTCHSFVGYLEEEAIKTYTRAIDELDQGKIPAWNNLPAPEIAKKYWHLKDDATMRDVLLVVRADEVRALPRWDGGGGAVDTAVGTGAMVTAAGTGRARAGPRGRVRCGVLQSRVVWSPADWTLLPCPRLQACHSHVNHTFAKMSPTDDNPFEPGTVHLP